MRTFSAVLLAAMCPSMVAGHGYVSAPWGRPYGCKLGHNTGCGNVQYEPQSVEGPDRYPETGVADGQIAAAGNPVWAQLSQTGVVPPTPAHSASCWLRRDGRRCPQMCACVEVTELEPENGRC